MVKQRWSTSRAVVYFTISLIQAQKSQLSNSSMDQLNSGSLALVGVVSLWCGQDQPRIIISQFQHAAWLGIKLMSSHLIAVRISSWLVEWMEYWAFGTSSLGSSSMQSICRNQLLLKQKRKATRTKAAARKKALIAKVTTAMTGAKTRKWNTVSRT